MVRPRRRSRTACADSATRCISMRAAARCRTPRWRKASGSKSPSTPRLTTRRMFRLNSRGDARRVVVGRLEVFTSFTRSTPRSSRSPGSARRPRRPASRCRCAGPSRFPMVLPRNMARRRPAGGGTWARSRSKSPTTACTLTLGYSRRSRLRGRLEGEAVHVERHVAHGRPPALSPFEHPARFFRGARADLDEVVGKKLPEQAGQNFLQQGGLGTRRVVFRQLGDALEQQRARPVVKVLRG